MRIIVDKKEYRHITRRYDKKKQTLSFHGSSLKDLSSISGEIKTYRDDGFLMYIDNVSDYLYQTIKNSIIELSNFKEDKKEKLLSPKELRESVYQNEPIIEYSEEFITVDMATVKFIQHLAEGNEKEAKHLQNLISEAKNRVRIKHPDI